MGARYGGDVQAIAKAIAQSDPALLAGAVRGGSTFKLSYGEGKSADISESDLVITETPRTGWAVASHSGESVALDLALTKELLNKGIVREAIRAIQDERKNSGLDVSDRIHVRWNSNDPSAAAIGAESALIAEEVLALSFERDTSLVVTGEELGLALQIRKSD